MSEEDQSPKRQDVSLANLCEYMEFGFKVPRLLEVEARVSLPTLRSGIISLLHWLKAQAKWSHEFRPLMLRQFSDGRLHASDAVLCELVQTSPLLSQLFVCDGKYIAFQEGVSLRERRQVKNFVDQHYHPRLMETIARERKPSA